MNDSEAHHSGTEPQRFTRKPRTDQGSGHFSEVIDRVPAIKAELHSLLAVCEEIISLGRERLFDPNSDLTYFAAEAIIIHFNDLVTHRLPGHVKDLQPDFPWRGIASTRNVLAHNDNDANRSIVWDAIPRDLPVLIRELVASVETVS